ncbi:MAG: hypothetical protein LBH43_10385 [Treponema sp.]|jgi:hypothetical protein|nr:hypothetical protein [Treponema sp.]
MGIYLARQIPQFLLSRDDCTMFSNDIVHAFVVDLTGTRLDIAKKLKEYTESKRNKDGTAVSAAFIKDGELTAAFTCGTQGGTLINQQQ